jgi:3-isopropylmalate/(R)-2-methylmalate dehydratase small subunit
MILTGYARHIRADLSPAQIIDPATFAMGDPALLAAQCLAAVDPDLAARAREGDLLVLDGVLSFDAGAEAAVIALQAVGMAAVVCRTAAPELQAVAAGYGLPILAAPEAAAAISEGALLRLDLERGQLETAGTRWTCAPLAAPALASVRRAQLLVRMRRVVEEEGFAE